MVLDDRTVRVEAIWTCPVIVVKGEPVARHPARRSSAPPPPRPPRRPAPDDAELALAARPRLGAGVGDHLHHAVAVLPVAPPPRTSPTSDGAGHVLAHLVEHLPPIEERGRIVGIEGQGAIEETERAVHHLGAVLTLGGDGGDEAESG